MEDEIWKDIPGYEGMYQASNYGKVRSLDREVVYPDGKICVLKGKELKPTVNTGGYNTVMLSKNSKTNRRYVSLWVAMAFLDHKPNGFKIIVDHIDGNRKNDKLSNLQLISNRENTIKGNKTKGGSSKYPGVSKRTFKTGRVRWRALIYCPFEKRQIELGLFKTELKAHEVYQTKLKEIKEREK